MDVKEANEACGWDEANKPYVCIGRDLQTGMLLWDRDISDVRHLLEL